MTIETLAGAVYQHADADVAPDLHRFLAVISNFYRSFLDSRQRLSAGFPLIEQDPPLAMFQHSGEAGPFTITAENVRQLTGGTVGVVSLPATYRKHPVLWASLAHETGGHDVLHADEALLPELTAGVKAMFGGGTRRRRPDDDPAARDALGLLDRRVRLRHLRRPEHRPHVRPQPRRVLRRPQRPRQRRQDRPAADPHRPPAPTSAARWTPTPPTCCGST